MNDDTPSFADPPFACPGTIVFNMPFPPSTNRIWRQGKGRTYLSNEYKAWRKECDTMLMMQRGNGRVAGKFVAHIAIDETKRRWNSDADNRAKVVLDALQRMRIIENDSLANNVTILWAKVDGCRVALAPAN